MEGYDRKKYQRGKKQFCLFAFLNIGTMLLSDYILQAIPEGMVYIINILLLLLMYCGFMWTWHVFAVISVISAISKVKLILVLIREFNWMIYAMPERLAQEGVWIAASFVMYALLKFGKALKYYVGVKRIERRKRLEGQEEENRKGS